MSGKSSQIIPYFLAEGFPNPWLDLLAYKASFQAIAIDLAPKAFILIQCMKTNKQSQSTKLTPQYLIQIIQCFFDYLLVLLCWSLNPTKKNYPAQKSLLPERSVCEDQLYMIQQEYLRSNVRLNSNLQLTSPLATLSAATLSQSLPDGLNHWNCLNVGELRFWKWQTDYWTFSWE